MLTNLLVLHGEVRQIAELRYTPAGIPLLNLTVWHVSEQMEAGMRRQAECEITAIVMGDLAMQSQEIKLGTRIKASGFLARRSLKSTQLVLHINELNIF